MTTIAAIAAHTAAGHASPVTIILYVIAAAVAYTISLYVWPTRTCPRCHGTLITQRGGRRARLCKHCRGTGRVRRIGATAVHSLYWTVLGDALRERKRDSTERRRPAPPVTTGKDTNP